LHACFAEELDETVIYQFALKKQSPAIIKIIKAL